MTAPLRSAVINAVVAMPLLVVSMILVPSNSVMSAFTASRPLLVLGSIAMLVMGAAALLMLLPEQESVRCRRHAGITMQRRRTP
jgi:hypothetical protein